MYENLERLGHDLVDAARCTSLALGPMIVVRQVIEDAEYRDMQHIMLRTRTHAPERREAAEAAIRVFGELELLDGRSMAGVVDYAIRRLNAIHRELTPVNDGLLGITGNYINYARALAAEFNVDLNRLIDDPAALAGYAAKIRGREDWINAELYYRSIYKWPEDRVLNVVAMAQKRLQAFAS